MASEEKVGLACIKILERKIQQWKNDILTDIQKSASMGITILQVCLINPYNESEVRAFENLKYRLQKELEEEKLTVAALLYHKDDCSIGKAFDDLRSIPYYNHGELCDEKIKHRLSHNGFSCSLRCIEVGFHINLTTHDWDIGRDIKAPTVPTGARALKSLEDFVTTWVNSVITQVMEDAGKGKVVSEVKLVSKGDIGDIGVSHVFYRLKERLEKEKLKISRLYHHSEHCRMDDCYVCPVVGVRVHL